MKIATRKSWALTVLIAVIVTLICTLTLAACSGRFNRKDDIPDINSNAVLTIERQSLSFALGMKVDDTAVIAACGCMLADDEGHEVSITKEMLDNGTIDYDAFDLDTVGKNKEISVSYKDKVNYIFYDVCDYNVTFYRDKENETVYRAAKAQAQLTSDLDLAVWVDVTMYNYSTDTTARTDDEYGASHFRGWYGSDGSAVTGRKALPVATDTVVNYELYAEYMTDAQYADYDLSYDNRGRRVFSGYFGSDNVADVPEGVTYIDLAAICRTSVNFTELRVPSTARLDVPITGVLNTTGLKRIVVDEGNAYYASYGGGLYSKDYRTLYLLPASCDSDTFHENLQVIGAYACSFWDGRALVIPDSVTQIGDYGFYNAQLTNIVINSNVTLGVGAFYGTNIPSMNIIDGNVASYSRLGEEDEKATYRLDRILDKTIERYALIDGTVEIATEAFKDCNALKSLDLGNTLEKINDSAFIDCTSLEEIKFPASTVYFGSGIFENCTTLTNVDMSELEEMYYVTNANTFPQGFLKNCTALTSVTMPAFIETIASSAFYGCTHLTEINVKDLPLKEIGSMAFHGMGSATDGFEMELPVTVESIGKQAFSHSHITGINFEELTAITNKTLAANVFEYSYLESITIPDQITEIPAKSFYYAPSLQTVNLNKTKTIGENAFYYSGVEHIDFGNTETIAKDAFAHCNSLVDVTLSDSVVTVNQYAFRLCDHLETFTLGKNTRIFGAYSFLSDGVTFGSVIPVLFTCPSLKEINAPAENEYFTSVDGILYARYVGTTATKDGVDMGDEKAVLLVFPANNGMTSYTLPTETTATAPYAVEGHKTLASINLADGLTNIGKATFYNSAALEQVIIPATVTTIGASIFLGCSSLSHVEIEDGNAVFSSQDGILLYEKATEKVVMCVPNTTEADIKNGALSIADAVFMNNTVITKIKIPNSVTAVGDKAFSGCTALETIEIGAGVREIGENAFATLTSLKKITVDSANEYFKTDATNTLLYSKDGKKMWLCAAKGDNVITDVSEVLDGVEEIGHYAFAYNDNLVTVKLPNGVKSIGDYAFYNCRNIATFYGSVDLERIGERAFSMEKLAGNAANDARYSDTLKTVLLYDAIETLGGNAFYGQFGIENSYFVMSEEQYAAFIGKLSQDKVLNYVYLTRGCPKPDESGYVNNDGNGVKVCIYKPSKPVDKDSDYDWFYFETGSSEPVKWIYE